MAQPEEFIFQNVAYWPTVYRTGLMNEHKASRDRGGFFNFIVKFYMELGWSTKLKTAFLCQGAIQI